MGSGVIAVFVTLLINENLWQTITGLGLFSQTLLIFFIYIIGIIIYYVSIVVENKVSMELLNRNKNIPISQFPNYSSGVNRFKFGGHPIELKWNMEVAEEIEGDYQLSFEDTDYLSYTDEELQEDFKLDTINTLIGIIDYHSEPQDIPEEEQEFHEGVARDELRKDIDDITNSPYIDEVSINVDDDDLKAIREELMDIKTGIESRFGGVKHAKLIAGIQSELSPDSFIDIHNKHLALSYLFLTSSIIFTGTAIVLSSISLAHFITS